MKNKMIMLILSAMLLVSFSGCNSDSKTPVLGTDEMSDDSNKDLDKQDEQDEQDEEDTKQLVKLYFSDDQAMSLIEVETELVLAKGESLEGKIIEALKSQPEDPAMFNAIDENIKINSVKVEGKLAKVDLSSENLNGSSTQETFLIDAIVASLTSLDTIDHVQFLVDGQEVETLMGHRETSKALTRDDITTDIIIIDEIER